MAPFRLPPTINLLLLAELLRTIPPGMPARRVFAGKQTSCSRTVMEESCQDSKWWRGKKVGNRSLDPQLQIRAISHLVIFSNSLAPRKVSNHQIATLKYSKFPNRQITAVMSTNICLIGLLD